MAGSSSRALWNCSTRTITQRFGAICTGSRRVRTGLLRIRSARGGRQGAEGGGAELTAAALGVLLAVLAVEGVEAGFAFAELQVELAGQALILQLQKEGGGAIELVFVLEKQRLQLLAPLLLAPLAPAQATAHQQRQIGGAQAALLQPAVALLGWDALLAPELLGQPPELIFGGQGNGGCCEQLLHQGHPQGGPQHPEAGQGGSVGADPAQIGISRQCRHGGRAAHRRALRIGHCAASG